MAARTSQVATELLDTATPNARVSQQASELLSSPGTVNTRVSQQAIETLDGITTANARVSQHAVELLVSRTYGETFTASLGDTGSLTKAVKVPETAQETFSGSGAGGGSGFGGGGSYLTPIRGPIQQTYINREAIQKGPKRFRITQITNQIKNEDYVQTLRLERLDMSQDWNFGIAANIGLPSSTNANAIITQSGFLKDVSMNNNNGPIKHVVSNGQPLTDVSFEPYVFQWDGGPLTVGVTVGNIQSGAVAYVWRWIYIAEDVYYNGAVLAGGGGNLPVGWTGIFTEPRRWEDLSNTLSGQPTLPYDVRANLDTQYSRRYWWPLIRCQEWLTDDGVLAMSSDTTLIDTWSNGPGIPSGSWTAYGNLVVGKNDFFGDQTAGFSGQQLWAAGSPGASALGTPSTMKYGVDFGISFSGTPVYYGIKHKQTPCYLNILVATTAGTAQFKRIPFMLVL